MTAWITEDVLGLFEEVPLYHVCLEVFLLVWVLWLIFHQSANLNEVDKLTNLEIEDIVEEWSPEPLVPEVPVNHHALHPYLVTSKAQKYVEINGKSCLNVATHNYLNLIGNEEIENCAINTLKKYGVGSCGPRGFYGTVDVHLDLEQRLADFMGMEEAVVYSYGFSTLASAIPAYAKRGDVIFVDQGVNFAIQKGLDASRSRIEYFKHNDVADLENLLLEQAELDVKNPKKAHVTRRFLIVEGIYLNTGTICPLPELIQLRNKYKLRIFVDESVSFGTLGEHGHGVTEYFNIPKKEVDMIMCSMEWAVGSIGGFCVGSSFIVEHQRLSGLGYCFSASLPPLLATAAIKALDLMEKNPSMFSDLQTSCELMHDALLNVKELQLTSHPHSPVKHLTLPESQQYMFAREDVLPMISAYCIQQSVAVICPAYLENVEKFQSVKSLRITVNNMLSSQDVKKVAEVLQEACRTVIVN